MARPVELEVPCPREDCEHTLLFEAEVRPGEVYGSDADGNRGIWIGPSLIPPEWSGETCEEGHLYSDEEVAALNQALVQAADRYEYEPSEPDYDL